MSKHDWSYQHGANRIFYKGSPIVARSSVRDQFYTKNGRPISGMAVAKGRYDCRGVGYDSWNAALSKLPNFNDYNEFLEATTTESTTMHNNTSIIDDIVSAAKRGVIESNLIDQFKSFGDDIYEDGSILTWTTNFGNPDGKTYSYAAIKCPVGWAITGEVSKCIDWYDLVGMFVTQHVTIEDVYAVTTVEGI